MVNRNLRVSAGVVNLIARSLQSFVPPGMMDGKAKFAGCAASAISTRVASPGADEPGTWGESQFWRRFAELFERRGWGRIGNEAVHPGVGALDAFDWVESNPELLAGRPACHFTSGLLANLLGRVCQDEVAVLEVEFGIGQGGFGRKKHQPAALRAPPFLEAREVEMAGERRHFEIVHAGAPQSAVREVEAGRLDDVDGQSQAGRHAQDRAGVAGDVGLVERDAERGRPGHAARGQELPPCNTRIDLRQNGIAPMAMPEEWVYRARLVNSNRRRGRWNS